MNNFGEKEAWAYPDSPFFWVPSIISGTGKATDFEFRPVHSKGPSGPKPIKIF